MFVFEKLLLRSDDFMTNIQLNINNTIQIFQKSIIQQLASNITEPTCATLANMLAIDYISRLEGTINAQDHLETCINKLKNFLEQKVMADDSFSTALTLFTVAIAPEEINYQDKNNILEQDQSQNAVVDVVIDSHFNEFNPKDMGKVKAALRNLLRDNGKKILDYINAEPQLFLVIINGSIAKHKTEEEINKYIKAQVNKILDKAINFNKRRNIFKQKASRITTAVCTVGAVVGSSLTGGAAMPMIVMAATMVSMKFAPKLGENIGQTILNFDSNTKSSFNEISRIKAELLQNNQQRIYQKEQEVEIKQFKTVEPDLIKKHDQKLETIKEALAEYKAHDSEVKEKNFQEQLSENKEMAKSKDKGGMST